MTRCALNPMWRSRLIMFAPRATCKRRRSGRSRSPGRRAGLVRTVGDAALGGFALRGLLRGRLLGGGFLGRGFLGGGFLGRGLLGGARSLLRGCLLGGGLLRGLLCCLLCCHGHSPFQLCQRMNKYGPSTLNWGVEIESCLIRGIRREFFPLRAPAVSGTAIPPPAGTPIVFMTPLNCSITGCAGMYSPSGTASER